MIRLLLAFYFSYLFFASYTTARRFKRETGNFVPTHNASDDQSRLNKYPTSPVEAFFGTGAHTHSMPLSTQNGPGPVGNDVTIGGFNVHNDIALQQTGLNHSHAVAGTNALGEHAGLDWHKEMGTYRKQVTDTAAAQGTNPHPYYLGPTHFFGRSPFEEDTDLNGGAIQTPTSGQHNIGGLNIGHSVQPSYPVYGHNHNLPGVDPFGKGVNWTDHFDQVLPHHANLAGQSATATGSAVKVVNPNIPAQASGSVPAATIGNGPSAPPPAPQPGFNPFANPNSGAQQQTQPAASTGTNGISNNPFISRFRW